MASQTVSDLRYEKLSQEFQAQIPEDYSLSTFDLLDLFWLEHNDGVWPRSGDALRAFYEGEGAVGESLQDLEFNFWSEYAPD